MRAGFPGIMSPASQRIFNPPLIANLQLWLDASDVSTITEVSDLVSQWDEKSGQGNNATQSTGDAQPTTGLDTINGKNVLDFDGTADFMDLDSDVTLADDFSVFVVWNTDDTASTRIALGNATLNIKMGIVSANSLFVRVQSLGSSDTTQTFPSGNSISYLTRDAADKVDQAFNGGSLNRLYSDAAQTGNTIFNRIGMDDSTNRWDGNIAEIIMYNRALSTAERAAVENYLSRKWGIFIAGQSIAAPTDINGNVLWLDADDDSTITKAAGLVSQWDDKSGQGNNATQGTGDNQPTTDSVTINSKNVLDFDGSTDFMSISGFNSNLSVNVAFSVFIVFKLDITTGRQVLIGSTVDANNRMTTQFDSVADVIVSSIFDGSFTSKSEAFSDTSNAHIVTMTNSAAKVVTQRVDGSDSATTTNDGETNTTVDTVIGALTSGGNRFLNGIMGEVVIYNRLLTTAERTAVEEFLSNKWNITLS